MALDWKNPWVLGGGGILLIVLLFASKGGSSGGGGAATSLASQNLATSGNVQLAAIQSQTDIARLQAQSAAGVYQAGAEANIAGMGLGYLANLDSNQVTRSNTRAAVTMNANNNLTATQIAGIGQATAFGLADRSITAIDRTMAGNLALQTEADQTTIKITGDNNDTYRQVAPQLAQISANSQVALAQTSAQTQNALAMIQRSMATDAQQAKGQSDMLGFAGNIFNGLVNPAASSGGLAGIVNMFGSSSSSGSSGGSSGGGGIMSMLPMLAML